MQKIIDYAKKLLKSGVYTQKEILNEIEWAEKEYEERNKQSKKVLQNKPKV